MGAQSVTGVGTGSADGSNKGSEHQTLGSVHHLIGPRVVACGSVVCSGTTGVVHFPLLTGTAGQYVVMITPTTSAHAYVSTALAFSTDASFTVTAGSGSTVYWAVLKTGL